MTRPTTGMLVLVLALVVRLVVGTLVPLHPDEAYYWEWSRHLAAGYFDHPPVIAWFIRAGSMILGDTPLGVRLFAVLSGFVAGWAVMRTAARLASPAAGDVAAIAFVAMPVMSGVFVLATPDAPLLLFTALSLWAVAGAVGATSAGVALRCWAGAGLACGLALASKYTAVVLPLGLFLGFLASPTLRGLLRTPGPYLAALLAALVFLPVLQWNAQHDWASFRFQLSHGLGAAIDAGAWKRELDLVGGQLMLASPLLGVIGLLALRQAIRDEGRVARVLAAVAIVTGLLFAWSALRRRVEGNWPAPAWVAIAIVLGTTMFARVSTRWRRVALGLGFFFTAILYLQSVVPVFPVPARRDPSSRAYGWANLGAAVNMALGTHMPRPWVAANRYQDAAELAFTLPGHPPVFSLNLGSRDNQYRLWPGFPDQAKAGDDLLMVLADRPDSVADPAITALTDFFGSVQKGEAIDMRRGTEVVSRRRLWLLRDWRGAWPRPAQ